MPLRSNFEPGTSRWATRDAGGARAVMKQLEPLLEVGALTVTGHTVGQNLAGDLDVPAAELQRRRNALRAPARTEERGWLSIYQRLVRPLPEGAVLREPAP
jgi:dihydroxyacid dehydratase/phosphogluconate dehydratase